MKRAFRIIGMMCMAALMAVTASSCKKTDEGGKVTVALSQVQGFEGDRAYIDIYDGCLMKWNEGDQIMVYNLASDYTQSVAKVFTADEGSERQVATTFSGEPVGAKKDIGYFYFFPAEKASGTLRAGNRETFNVPAVQTFDESVLFDPDGVVMACSVDAIPDDFTMQHIFGFLNLRVTYAGATNASDAEYISSIVVEDNNMNLSGTVSLKLPEVSATAFSNLLNEFEQGDQNYASDLSAYLQQIGYDPQGNGKTITLDCSQAQNGMGVKITSQRRYLFVCLRPGALYKGFKITVNFSDQTKEPQVFEFPANDNMIIKPGFFRNITLNIQ